MPELRIRYSTDPRFKSVLLTRGTREHIINVATKFYSNNEAGRLVVVYDDGTTQGIGRFDDLNKMIRR